MLKLKRILYVLSKCIFLMGLGFVIVKFYDSRHFISDFLSGKQVFNTLFPPVFIYILAVACSAFGWITILRLLEKKVKITLLTSLDIYGRSVISKYTPGNFFQYLQRSVLTLNLGIGVKTVIRSILIELIIVIALAGLIALVGLCLRLNVDSFYIGIFSLVSAVLLYAIFTKTVEYLFSVTDSVFISMAVIFIFYISYFLFTGIAFLYLLTKVGYQSDLWSSILAICYFSLSFVAGILIPGSPAGIGVREAIIIYIFSPMIGSAASFFVATSMRFVTMAGDFSFMIIVAASNKIESRRRDSIMDFS